MAYPVIIFNSSTGDDSLSSGAGPATAINSNTTMEYAETSADGLTVSFTGAVDLSGIATDGSHVIYLEDGTVANRKFGKITAVDDGADELTVSTAFGGSLSSLNWAIGGYRQTLANAFSKCLFINNVGDGDMEAGWTVELASGFTENPGAIVIVGSGVHNNPKTLRGEAGAATKPVLTVTTNVSQFGMAGSYWHIKDLDVDRTGNTNAQGYVATSGGGDDNLFENIKTTGGTLVNRWPNCITMGTSTHQTTILNCDFSFSYYELIDCSRGLIVKGCKLRSAGSSFIKASDYNTRINIEENEMYGCGLNASYSTAAGVLATNYSNNVTIARNTIVDSGGDGIYLNQGYLGGFEVYANTIAGSGGYGINASASTYLWIGSGNLIYDSTSGISNNIENFTAASTADPDFVDAAGGDVTPQTDLAGVAVADKFKPSASFLYPGCIQPEAGTTTNIVVKHPRRGIF